MTSFASPMPMASAFTKEFCAFLNEHLPRSANPQVVSLSECVAQFDRLILSGLRVMTQKVSCGTQKVIIRFREVLGSIHHFFAVAHRGYLNEDVNLPQAPSSRLPQSASSTEAEQPASQVKIRKTG